MHTCSLRPATDDPLALSTRTRFLRTASACWIGSVLAASLSAQSPLQSQRQVPYALPVSVPSSVVSPPEDAGAPYTPLVLNLIRQLERHNPPTREELENASLLLTTQGGTYAHPQVSNTTCHNLANSTLRVNTTPSIMPMCFSDGLGLNVVAGPNAGKTTGLPSMLMLASSFDLQLANAMGQVEGREGRNLMVTGLLGPQADTDVFVNWYRGHHTPGEDPFLNAAMTAAQINGIQGQGLMAQVKHFAVYYGADGGFTDVQDQALHEIYLPPYELALREAKASSVMCSYQKLRDSSPFLRQSINTLSQPSPFPGASPKTWPLNEAHFACENPLLLTYVLRDLWHSQAFVATDYGAAHSAHGFLQGDEREDPSKFYLGATNPEGDDGHVNRGLDAGSSTCADSEGKTVACSSAGAIAISGIPGPDCPATGCSIVNAVLNGTVPLSVFNQALARILYQQERFGYIGCDNTTAGCKNPGGIGGDRSGLAPLPTGNTSGAPLLGTKNGDAAISERVAEEGAVLLKNESHALPITPADLKRGIAVSGAGAEYLIANPNNEGAAGFADRNAISPLSQLKSLSGMPTAFSYTPANSPTGRAVPCSVLSSVTLHGPSPKAPPSIACDPQSGLQRLDGASLQTLSANGVDKMVDYTSASALGPLRGGKVYLWTGWMYVPAVDTYAFRFQHSSALPDSAVSFTFDNSQKTLIDTVSFYQGQYYGNMSVPVSPTNEGYVESNLKNRQCAVPQAKRAATRELIVSCAESPAVGWHRVTLTLDATSIPAGAPVSFRFAFSRVDGDIADAAADAKGKAVALVFVDDQGRDTVPQSTHLSSLNPAQVRLIQAVAAENPNTVVVLNTGTPIVLKEWIDNPHVKALLNMWQPGQEGGTATARLVLGQANPGGHVTVTWPKDHSDTINDYDQTSLLYAGDTLGKHPERLKGSEDAPAKQTQGIYSGYRYYDQLGLQPQFPFGFGLSYTTFRFSDLKLTSNRGGSVLVEFDTLNTGTVAGTTVPQVYVGAGHAVTGVQQAVRSLRAFDRIELAPGENKHVKLTLDTRSFQYWSEPEQRWITNDGPRTIWVGDADALEHLPLSGTVIVTK